MGVLCLIFLVLLTVEVFVVGMTIKLVVDELDELDEINFDGIDDEWD